MRILCVIFFVRYFATMCSGILFVQRKHTFIRIWLILLLSRLVVSAKTHWRDFGPRSPLSAPACSAKSTRNNSAGRGGGRRALLSANAIVRSSPLSRCMYPSLSSLYHPYLSSPSPQNPFFAHDNT